MPDRLTISVSMQEGDGDFFASPTCSSTGEASSSTPAGMRSSILGCASRDFWAMIGGYRCSRRFLRACEHDEDADSTPFDAHSRL